MFEHAAQVELSRQELATTPRHLAPIDQNAELLARAEKALADVEMAGQERGGRYYQETQGQGGGMEVTGLKSATADWYKEATTGQKKLSRKRVEVALNKIIEDQGKDTGSDVQRIKELLLGDSEFEYSPYAPRSEEERARARQYAMAEWEPDIAMGGGAPERPAPKTNKRVSKAEQNILDRIVQHEPKTEGLSFRALYTAALDNLHPIYGALKDVGKDKLPTAQNPYELERLTRGTMGKGTEFIKYGAFKFDTYETVTKGYEQILAPVKKDLDGFRAYMVAKRTLEKSAQGIETGVDVEQARAIVKAGASKYQKVHEERLRYRDALLQYLVDSGVIAKDKAAAMREANKDYVPFYRFFEEAPGGRASSSRTIKDPTKRMRGSERQILDPIMSDIKDTFLFIGLAEKNAARQAYVKHPELAQKQPPAQMPVKLREQEIQKLFDEFLTVRKETKKTSTTSAATTEAGAEALSKPAKMVVEKVKEALMTRGYHEGEAEQLINRVAAAKNGREAAQTIVKEVESTTYVPELDIRVNSEAATIFRAMKQPLRKDEIDVFEKGTRHVYKVDPAVAEAFQDLDKISTNIVTEMLLHTPANLLRAGVIVTPEYISRNIIRDAVSAFVYAGSNPIKTIQGGISILKKDTAYQNWLKGGGANATMVAIDRDYVQGHLMDLNVQTGAFQRAWNVARTPIDVLRAASEFVENSTRLGSVRSEMQRAKDKAAIQALSLIARESTVDFARHGKNLQEFGKMTAFFNPTLQGIDRFVRATQDNPAATISKSLASVTLPALLLWWANKDDEEINNLPRWQRDTMLITRVPLPDGGSFLLRIPLAHELGVLFATLPTRLLDGFVKDNPDALRDLDKTLMAAFTPGIIPTVAIPMVTQGTNTNPLSGGPLIPASQEKLLPEYQYTQYTTELTKAIGSVIGAFPGMEKATQDKSPVIGGTARALTSPILVENYVRSWTGGMGVYLLQLADKGLREANVLPDPVKPAWTLADIPLVRAFVARYPSASAQSIQTFYEDADSSKVRYNTFFELANSGDQKAIEFIESHKADMVQLDAITEALNQHAQLVRMINKNPEQTPEEKRQLIDTLYYRMIELSRAGNQLLRQLKEAQ